MTHPITWSSPDRQALFFNWLETVAGAYHLTLDSLCLASADASFRRYFRIKNASGRSYIIMDAPPEKEDCHAFVRVAKLLQEAQVHSPQIFEWQSEQGWMLLSDLGHSTLLQHLEKHPKEADDLLKQSLALLIQWQQASKPHILPDYDHALLKRELDLFPQWYVAEHKKHLITPDEQHLLNHTFETIIQHNLSGPRVFVHRDFMPRNLLLDENKRLGVVDFQDAVYGPITYDIASLMRDAFYTWQEERVVDMTVRYWEKAKLAGLFSEHPLWESDFAEFWKAVDWMALQRHLKILGIFARLTLRDHKNHYLADTPRFIMYIRQIASRYRELTGLLRFIDRIENLQAASGFAFGRL